MTMQLFCMCVFKTRSKNLDFLCRSCIMCISRKKYEFLLIIKLEYAERRVLVGLFRSSVSLLFPKERSLCSTAPPGPRPVTPPRVDPDPSRHLRDAEHFLSSDSISAIVCSAIHARAMLAERATTPEERREHINALTVLELSVTGPRTHFVEAPTGPLVGPR